MLDGICALIFFGFFGFVIYATVLVPRAQRAAQPAHVPEAPPPPRKPGPGGLYCVNCPVDAGVVSLGLSTTVLPAAMAGANFQIAIIIG